MANDEIKVNGGNINELMDSEISLDVDVNINVNGEEKLKEVAETIDSIENNEEVTYRVDYNKFNSDSKYRQRLAKEFNSLIADVTKLSDDKLNQATNLSVEILKALEHAKMYSLKQQVRDALDIIYKESSRRRDLEIADELRQKDTDARYNSVKDRSQSILNTANLDELGIDKLKELGNEISNLKDETFEILSIISDKYNYDVISREEYDKQRVYMKELEDNLDALLTRSRVTISNIEKRNAELEVTNKYNNSDYHEVPKVDIQYDGVLSNITQEVRDDISNEISEKLRKAILNNDSPEDAGISKVSTYGLYTDLENSGVPKEDIRGHINDILSQIKKYQDDLMEIYYRNNNTTKADYIRDKQKSRDGSFIQYYMSNIDRALNRYKPTTENGKAFRALADEMLNGKEYSDLDVINSDFAKISKVAKTQLMIVKDLATEINKIKAYWNSERFNSDDVELVDREDFVGIISRATYKANNSQLIEGEVETVKKTPKVEQEVKEPVKETPKVENVEIKETPKVENVEIKNLNMDRYTKEEDGFEHFNTINDMYKDMDISEYIKHKPIIQEKYKSLYSLFDKTSEGSDDIRNVVSTLGTVSYGKFSSYISNMQKEFDNIIDGYNDRLYYISPEDRLDTVNSYYNQAKESLKDKINSEIDPKLIERKSQELDELYKYIIDTANELHEKRRQFDKLKLQIKEEPKAVKDEPKAVKDEPKAVKEEPKAVKEGYKELEVANSLNELKEAVKENTQETIQNTKETIQNTKETIELSKELTIDEYSKLSMGDKFTYDMLHSEDKGVKLKEEPVKKKEEPINPKIEVKQEEIKEVAKEIVTEVEQEVKKDQIELDITPKIEPIKEKEEPKVEQVKEPTKVESSISHDKNTTIKSSLNDLVGNVNVENILKLDNERDKIAVEKAKADAKLLDSQTKLKLAENKSEKDKVSIEKWEKTKKNSELRAQGYIANEGSQYDGYFVGLDDKGRLDKQLHKQTVKSVQKYDKLIQNLDNLSMRLAGTELGEKLKGDILSYRSQYTEADSTKSFPQIKEVLDRINNEMLDSLTDYKEKSRANSVDKIQRLDDAFKGIDTTYQDILNNDISSNSDKLKQLSSLMSKLNTVDVNKNQLPISDESTKNKVDILTQEIERLRVDIVNSRNRLNAKMYGEKATSYNDKYNSIMNDSSMSERDKLTQLTQLNSKLNSAIIDKDSLLDNLTDQSDIAELEKVGKLLIELKAQLGEGRIELNAKILDKKQLDILDSSRDKLSAVQKEIESFDIELLGEDDLGDIKRLQSILNEIQRDNYKIQLLSSNEFTVKSAQEILEITKKTKSQLTQMSNQIKKSSVSVKTLSNGFKSVVDRVDRISMGLKGVAMSIASLYTLKNSIQLIGGRAVELEKLNLSFEVLIGNEEKAKRLMKDIQDLAAKSPLEIPEVSHGANLLLGAGMKESEVMDLIRQIGDLSQGDSAKFESIARAISQSYGMKRTMGEELRQLEDANVSIRPEIAKNLGITVQELQKMLEKGTLGIDPLLDAIESLTGDGGRFDGMLERQSQTVYGLFTTVKDKLIMLGVDATAESFNLVGQYLENIITYLDDIDNSVELEEISREISMFTEELLESVVTLFNTVVENREFLLSLFTSIMKFLGWCIEHSKVLIGIWAANKGMKGLLAFKDIILGADKGLIACVREARELFDIFKNSKNIGAVADVADSINDITDMLPDYDDTKKIVKAVDKAGDTVGGTATGAVVGGAVSGGIGATFSKFTSWVTSATTALSKFAPAIGTAIAALGTTAYVWDKYSSKGNQIRKEEDIDKKFIGALDIIGSREFIDSLNEYDANNLSKVYDNLTNVEYVIEALLHSLPKQLEDREFYKDNIEYLEDKRDRAENKGDTSEVERLDLEIAEATSQYDRIDSAIKKAQSDLEPLLGIIESKLPEHFIGLMALYQDSTDILNSYYSDITRDALKEYYIKFKAYSKDVLKFDMGIEPGEYADRVFKKKENTEYEEQKLEEEEKLNTERLEVVDKFKDLQGKVDIQNNKVLEYQTYQDLLKQVIEKEKERKDGDLSVDAELFGKLYDNPLTRELALYISDPANIEPEKLKSLADEIFNQIYNSISDSNKILTGYYKEAQTLGSDILNTPLANDTEIISLLEGILTSANKGIATGNIVGRDVDHTQKTATYVSQTETAYQKYINQLEKEVSLGKLSNQQYLNRLLTAQKQAEKEEEIADIQQKIYDQRKVVLEEKRSDIDYDYDMALTSGDNSKELAINADLHDKKLAQVKDYYNQVKNSDYLGAEDRRQMLKDLELDLKNLAEEGKDMRLAVVDAEVQEIANKYSMISSLIDSNRNYSNAWLELNYWQEAINLRGLLEGKTRVHNEQERQVKNDLLSIEEQIAKVKKSSEYNSEQKAEKLNDLEKQKIEILANQKTAQLQYYQDLANSYTDTMTEAINKVYDNEIAQLDRIAKARKEQQEDEDLDEREKELRKKIAFMSGATTLEGKKQLEELEKQLKELEREKENLKFDREHEEKRDELSKDKDSALAKLPDKAREFANTFNTGILAGLNTMDEKLKAIAKNTGTLIGDSLINSLKGDLKSMQTYNNIKTINTDNRNFTVQVKTNDVNKVNTAKILSDLDLLPSLGR